MRTFISHFVLTLSMHTFLAFIGVATAFCQDNPTSEQGISANRSYQVGQFDSVSTMNGNLTLHIPLVSFPQRGGLSLSFSLQFGGNFSQTVTRDSKGLAHVSYRSGGGPSLVEDSAASVRLKQRSGRDAQGNGLYTNIVSVSDVMGGVHSLGYDASYNYAQMRSTDGSGYLFVPSDPQLYKQNASAIIDSVPGILYNSRGIAINGGTVVSDPNGNKISYSVTGPTSGSYVDSVGRSIPAFIYNPTTSTSGCPIINAQYQPLLSSQSWTVPGPIGGTQIYLFCYSSVTASRDDGNVLSIETHPALQSVVLPNKTYWAFVYDSMNPSGTGPLSYGDLLQVTTPQGGSISYTYGPATFGPVARNFCWGDTNYIHSVTTRSVNAGDGRIFTWQYAYAAPGTDGNAGDFSTTVTDPSGNNTVYNYQSLMAGGCVNVEKNHQVYSGSSTLLRTVATSYTSGVTNPQSALSSASWLGLAGFYPQTETTTLDNGQSASKTYSYDSGFPDDQPVCNINSTTGALTCPATGSMGGQIPLGLRTEEKSTDFGGVLLRDTKTAYIWQTNNSYKSANLLNEPLSATIFNGGGQQVVQTTYAYDENNGSPQGIFGNQTSITRWLNTGGTSPKTQTVYNSSGMPVKQIDASLNTMQITYDSTGAFPGQIQYPTTSGVTQIEKFNYDFNTGLLNSHTDQNNQVTSYQYDMMLRPISVSHPDGGSTTNCYTDVGGAGCSQSAHRLVSLPPS